MTEHEAEATRIAVLKAQFAELGRRVEEVRADVHAEQLETREEMKDGFARLDQRYNGLDGRVRTVEAHQGQLGEKLNTWRIAIPVLSGLASGIGVWTKELLALLKIGG